MVAHIGKMASDKKEAILMAIILGGGFMSGLMYGDMKIIMEQKAPWFNRINPSSVITDAFYALNVFGVGPRYYRAVTYMALVSFVMLVIGFVLSRKSSYKSL
jgi:ABC-2 type transport system permease protein